MNAVDVRMVKRMAGSTEATKPGPNNEQPAVVIINLPDYPIWPDIARQVKAHLARNQAVPVTISRRPARSARKSWRVCILNIERRRQLASKIIADGLEDQRLEELQVERTNKFTVVVTHHVILQRETRWTLGEENGKIKFGRSMDGSQEAIQGTPMHTRKVG